jgi:hypothetical protein
MGRIPLSGKRHADSKLVSVTFSNKSGGSFSLPVGDGHEQGEMDELPQRKRPRLSFADWATRDTERSEK